MRRGDPAADLVERAVRQWQWRESATTAGQNRRDNDAEQGGPNPQGAGISAIAVGAFGGFLGAIVSLGFNVAGARAFGIEPLRLLRIYATVIGGRAALDMSRSDFFIAAFMLHLATGLLFGAAFAIGARRFCCSDLRHFVLVGAAYGIALWLTNFYGILSWLQPMLNGGPFILAEIPIPIAILTHVSYGLTVALVTYPFQRDFASSTRTD